MATKDITDLQVLQTYEERATLRDLPENKDKHVPYVDELLSEKTNQPLKVCYRAMERAERRGYLEYGMWLRGAWLTEKGEAFLAEQTKLSE